MKSYRDFGIELDSGARGQHRLACPKCEPGRKTKGNKDLSVDADLGAWLCHHCAWSGGLPKDAPYVSRRNTAQSTPEVPRNANLGHSLIPLSTRGMEFLQQRGISEDTARAAGVMSGAIYSHKQGVELESIAFPVMFKGEIVNVKSRAIDSKEFSQSKGGSQTALFNGDSMDGADTIVFTEGELDTLSVMEAGYPCAVSCPNGAPALGTKNLDVKLEFIEANKVSFESASKIILAMDKDEPGLAFERIMIERLGAKRCWQVNYPEGCKDANDVLMKHGKAELVKILDKAKPCPVEGIETFNERIDDILEYHKTRGAKKLFSTGIRAIDANYKHQLGTLTIVTGIPSHGKSEMVDQFIVNSAALHRWKWAIFSPENYPMEIHFQKLAEKWLGKPLFNPSDNSRWSIEPMTEQEVRDSVKVISEFVKILTITECGNSIDGILNRVDLCYERDKISAFSIDPWNEVEHQRPAKMSETEYISFILSRIRNFSRLRNLACFIVAHPKLMQRDPKTGKFPVPSPYDISGSANWRNKADNCLCVWREADNPTGIIELHVQKVRNKNAGKAPEIVKLQWTRATGRITDVKTTQDETRRDWQ